MQSTLNSVRVRSTRFSAARCWALGMACWLGGCGGSSEVAKPAAPPVQVQWNRADGADTSEEKAAPTAGGDDKGSVAGEIDLDALAAEKAAHNEGRKEKTSKRAEPPKEPPKKEEPPPQVE